MKWRDWLTGPMAGGVGVVAALCCAGSSTMIGIVGAVGASFLVNDLILLPLLGAALMLSTWGLIRGRRVHQRTSPLWLGLAASLALVVAIFVGPWLAWLAGAVLVGVSMWNATLTRG